MNVMSGDGSLFQGHAALRHNTDLCLILYGIGMMSASRPKPRHLGEAEPEESGEYVRVPAVVNANGDKVVTISIQGRQQTCLVAELVLASFVGPRPLGHVPRFKDGNRLNCALKNLEWVPSPFIRDEPARAGAIAIRERADAIRRSLENRQHSDSAELVAEDRRR